MVLLDWEKAFDKVDREGMFLAMDRMGVDDKLVRMVKLLYKETYFNLREFVFNSRHPDPRRVLGRCRAAVRGPDPLDPRDPRDPGESGDGMLFARFRCVLLYLVTRVTLRCDVFLTFSYPSHLKHLLLKAFLESCFPEMLSKVGVLAERSLKK